VAAALATACKDDMYNNAPDEPLKLSIETLTVDLSEQTSNIAVTARDDSWTMSGTPEWLSLSPASGDKGISRVTLSFAAYDTESIENPEPRTATLTFSSGGQEKTLEIIQLAGVIIPPDVNADYSINEALHRMLAADYYNSEPLNGIKEGFDQTYNQSYDKFYYNYLSSLTLNTFDNNIWSMGRKNVLHSYIERNPVGTANSSTPPLNYGMEFELLEMGGRMVARVLYVETGSPAARKGLKRGDWFHRVNGTALAGGETQVTGFDFYYQRFIDTLVNPISGISPTLSMLEFRSNSMDFRDDGRTITLTPENWKNNPVLATQVFNVTPIGAAEPVNVGYLVYNNFDPAFEADLVKLFRDRYKPANLDYFILDLRYNKNGSSSMANLMGNLLVGSTEGVAGTTFADYEFLDPSRNRTVSFAEHPQSLALKQIFILTSRHTAGPAELLINALRGIDQNTVKLVVVGETTRGLAAGMVRRTYIPPDSEWEYSAWMLSCVCENAAGQGDYMYGLIPNGGQVNELDISKPLNMKWPSAWGWDSREGATRDQHMQCVVDMIRGNMEFPANNVHDSSKHDLNGYPRKYCFPTNLMVE
jgi:C-terminal processing protease CtpA/Prc